MVIIGAEIAWFETGLGPGFFAAWLWNGLTVGIGELAACYVLGMILLYVLGKHPRAPARHSRRAARLLRRPERAEHRA